MARIRSMKPEFRRSRTVTGWPRDVRLTWALLWGYLDDQGRGEDDLQLLKADLYPRDRDVSEKKLDGWLWQIVECKEDAPLCRYTVDGRDYLHATNWQEHQRINRPTASRLPHCPVHEDGLSGHVRNHDASRSTPRKLREDSVSPHGAISEPSPLSRAPAEQGAGSKGAGEQGALVAPSKRRRDEVWETMLAVCGIRPDDIGDDARGAYNKAAATLRGVRATSDEIRTRAENFRSRWPSASLTPTALARRWAEVAAVPEPARQVSVGTQRALAAHQIADRLREAGQ